MAIKPLGETPESVTLSRRDFEAMLTELEDAEDKIEVLQDCLNYAKPGAERNLLSMDETMRIIDGESPIKVWREKRGMSVRQLADTLELHDIEIEEIEKGRRPNQILLMNIASKLDVLTDMLIPPKVAP